MKLSQQATYFLTTLAAVAVAIAETSSSNNEEVYSAITIASVEVQVQMTGVIGTEHVERISDITSGFGDILVPELQYPSTKPTIAPTPSPTFSMSPTSSPTGQPTTTIPTVSHSPTMKPTADPTKFPTVAPTAFPTKNPTKSPTSNPTTSPTKFQSNTPTEVSSFVPTNAPSFHPTVAPTTNPTFEPTKNLSGKPTGIPSPSPSENFQVFSSMHTITIDVSNTAPQGSGDMESALMDKMTEEVFQNILFDSLSKATETVNKNSEHLKVSLIDLEIIDQWVTDVGGEASINTGHTQEILNVKFVVSGEISPRKLDFSFEKYIFNDFLKNIDAFYDDLTKATPFFQLLTFSRLSDQSVVDNNTNGSPGNFDTNYLLIGFFVAITASVMFAAFVYRRKIKHKSKDFSTQVILSTSQQHSDENETIPPAPEMQSQDRSMVSDESSRTEYQGGDSTVLHIANSEDQTLSFGLLSFFNCTSPSVTSRAKPTTQSPANIKPALLPIMEERRENFVVSGRDIDKKAKRNSNSNTFKTRYFRNTKKARFSDNIARRVDIVDTKKTQRAIGSSRKSPMFSGKRSDGNSECGSSIDFPGSVESSFDQDYNGYRNICKPVMPAEDSASLPTVSEMTNETDFDRRRRKEEIYRLTERISF